MKIQSSLCLLLVAVVAVAGCSKKESASAAAPAQAAPAAAPAPAPVGPRVVTVEATDAMKFSVTRIEATAGEELKVVLKNVGTLPKEAMGHNWVLLKKGTDVMGFSTAALQAKATEYIPAAMATQVIAHTKLLGPKQSDEVTFKAPSEAGEYAFICSFPAHAMAGMRGVLIVK